MWTGYLVFIQDKQPGILYYRVYQRMIRTNTIYTIASYYKVYQRVTYILHTRLRLGVSQLSCEVSC